MESSVSLFAHKSFVPYLISCTVTIVICVVSERPHKPVKCRDVYQLNIQSTIFFATMLDEAETENFHCRKGYTEVGCELIPLPTDAVTLFKQSIFC